MTWKIAALFIASLMAVSCGDGTDDTGQDSDPQDQGSGATGGGGGSSSPPSCEDMTCVRAFECVRECGGEILASGCCKCTAPLFDNISCPDESPRECEEVQCFVPIECVAECGGEIQTSSCCPCEPPLIDKGTCD